ncbi:pyridoxal-phosphate-dependent aminotransferase family protein [Pelolinea submarina]|uniref:Putative phosphoserine aminotransferase n=1 Tax=Pelolinea submarina TaxID=913107 RepID=A0A3E0A8B8_9CHLR|nr:alanine--glyoxylate aminotransferase family protein [Pelolinea submarina]REG07163.1 putative phosphoserine aminotransferase [Pelolinea submarina]
MAHMFVPGPVDVAPEVLQAMAQPMLPHRGKEYEAIHRRAAEKAQQIFYTQYRVFIGTHSGSGMQETGIRNLVEKDVLSCVNGAFSERWYDVAVSNGKSADRLDFEWGKAVEPDALRDALKKKHYEAVTIVHNETSTGVESPLKELAAVVREVSPDTFILVDAVSSLAGSKIEMDAWDVDFLLTSSQKCLALPPGLSLAGVNDRAMEKAAKVQNRGWYFDLLLMEKHRVKNSTAMTPVIPLVYALDFQLDRILAEGLDARFARHAAMSQRVYDWAEAHGMTPYADASCRSKTVATIGNDRNLNISDLNKFLMEKYQIRIANGYGDLKDKTFRIATMGETSMQDVDTLLAGMEAFMAQ